MADYTSYELGNILKRLEKRVDAALCCCESLELKNLGLGVPIYVGRFKNYLKIRSLVAGTNMNITYDSNTITFDSLAGGFTCSDLNSCSTSNLPEGSNLYYTDARVLSYMTGKNISIFTNDSGYITSSALTPYLTITSAASTYYPIPTGTTLQYLRGDGSLSTFPTIPTVGTWGALNYPTWVSGTPFVKMTAAGTFALDTNTYLTSAVTSVATSTGLTGGTITSTGTLSLNSKLAPLDTLTGNSLKLARVNVGETAVEYFTPTYGTGSVTSVGTTGLISGGPITTTGTVTTSMNTNKLVGRSSVGTGVMEEITVGAGLSLSAGTLTASGASPLTTKGDLYTYSTIDARLPVGLDTQILLADSSTTTGLKWGTNTAATPLGYYGAFEDVTTQSAVLANTAYPVKFNTINLANGVSVVNDGSGNPTRVTLANTGIYNIQFSLQLEKTGGSGNMTVDVWVRKNGVDIPSTTGKVVLTGSVSASPVVAAWNYVLDLAAGDYVELMWATSNNNVVIIAVPATPPHPSIPSSILTVTQQSGIMAGTGITAINSLTAAAQTLSSTDLTITSAVSTHSFVIANNAVTDAKLRQSAGLSLIGRSTNSTGNVADITATTANSSLRLNPAGTALAFSTAPLSVLISNHNTTAVLSSTNYIQITGAASAVAAGSIASRQTAFPIGATAQNMYVKTNATQSATGSLVISLTIGATPSALSVTVAAGSAAGTFSNTSTAVAIAAGNLLTYEIKNNATLTSASIIGISTCFY
jgi:hypothetical protein